MGRAYVVVKAITKGLDKDIDDAVKRSMAKAEPEIKRSGAAAGAAMGEAMGDEAGERVTRKVTKKVSDDLKKAVNNNDDFKRAGNALGEAIGRDISRGLSINLKDRIRESLDIDDETKRRITASSRSVAAGVNEAVTGALLSVGKLAKAAPPMAAIAGAAQAIVLYAGQAVPLLSTMGQAISGAALGLASLAPAAIVGLGAGVALFKTETETLEQFKQSVSGLGEQWKVLGERVQDTALPATRDLATVASTVLPQAFALTFSKAGESLAEISNRFQSLLEDSGFVARLSRIGEAGADALAVLGDAIADLVEIFVVLFDNLRPLTERTTEWVAGLTETWKQSLLAAEASGKLGETLDRWADAAAQWGQILRNTWEALKDIFAVASPGAKQLADDLEGLTEQFANWTASVEGQERITQYFEDSREVFDALNRVMGSIGEQFRRAFELSPGGADLIDFLDYLADELIPNLGTAAIQIQYPMELLIGLVEKLNDILSSLIGAGFFTALGDAMNAVLSVLLDLLEPIAALVNSGLGEFLAPLAATFAIILGPATRLGGVLALLAVHVKTFIGGLAGTPGVLGKTKAGFKGALDAINPWTAAVAYGVLVWGEYSAAQKAATAASDNFAKSIGDLDRSGRLEKLYETLEAFSDPDFIDILVPFADWAEDGTEALETLTDAGVTSLGELEDALYQGGDVFDEYRAKLEEVARLNDEDLWDTSTAAQREQASAADALLVILDSLNGSMEEQETRQRILAAATGDTTGATLEAADAADTLKKSWADVGEEIQREAEAAQAAIEQTVSAISGVGSGVRVKLDAEFEELDIEDKLREAAAGVYDPETGEVEVEPIKLPVDLKIEELGDLTSEQREQLRLFGDLVQNFLDQLELEAKADPSIATDENLAKLWDEYIDSQEPLLAEVFPGFGALSDQEKADLIAEVTGVDIPALQTEINVDEAQARAEAVAAIEGMIGAIEEKRAELDAALSSRDLVEEIVGDGALSLGRLSLLQDLDVATNEDISRIKGELAALESDFGELYVGLTVEGQEELENVKVELGELDGEVIDIQIDSNADEAAADIASIADSIPEDGIKIEVGTEGVPESEDDIVQVTDADYEAVINVIPDGLANVFRSIQSVALQEYVAVIDVEVSGLSSVEDAIDYAARDRTVTITVNEKSGSRVSGGDSGGLIEGTGLLAGLAPVQPGLMGVSASPLASTSDGALAGSSTSVSGSSSSGGAAVVVNIGSIASDTPRQTAREIALESRAEAYRMGLIG